MQSSYGGVTRPVERATAGATDARAVRQNILEGKAKMKIFIILCVLALILPTFGCQEDQGIAPSTSLQIPEPELVPYANIPYPPPATLYRISGAALTDGPAHVLERVLAEGFDLKKAWHPQVNLCMAPFLDELIIELGEPDDDIYRLGFSSDFDGTAGPCASHWNEYRLINDE